MQQIRLFLRQTLRSIAFLPTLIAGAMVLLAVMHVFLFQDDWFQDSIWQRLALADGDSARTVLGAVIGGMFTLVIFTFTMVMSVVSRSIGNYSPRLLPVLLGERYHQVTMGFTLGTIAYALVLFFGISSERSNLSAALGVSIVIVFVTVCLGLFVFFIHRISKSIHVNYLIRYSYDNTLRLMDRYQKLRKHLDHDTDPPRLPVELRSHDLGYLGDVELSDLADWCARHDRLLELAVAPGTFVARGAVLFRLDRSLTDRQERHLRRLVLVSADEPLQVYEVGLKHLAEVAVKAMSPSLNDPGTALTALDYLTEAMRRLMEIESANRFTKGGGTIHFHRFPAGAFLNELWMEMAEYYKHDPALRSATRRAFRKLRTYADRLPQTDWPLRMKAIQQRVFEIFLER